VACQHEFGGGVANVLPVERTATGVGEGEEIDGIEQVGLTLSVVSYEAVDFWRELQVGVGYVAVVEYGELLESHVCVNRV